MSTYLTAKQISSLVVPMLTRQLVLPNTVLRVPAGSYAGPNGGTVTIRVPAAPLAARTQTAGSQITWDALTETGVDVTVAHYYSATKVTDEDLTLKLVDFGAQVLAPMIAGIANKAEDSLAAIMNGLAADASFALAPTAADTVAKILHAREVMTKANVPTSDRTLAVSPEILTRLLSIPELTKIDNSGAGGESALRDATVGRLYGFNIVESNALTAGTAVAYDRAGFTWANFAPQPTSNGAGVDLSTVTVNGITMRVAVQWLADFLSMGVVVQTFAGAAEVDTARTYKFDTATS